MSGRRRKNKSKLLEKRPRHVLGKEQRYHQQRDEGSDKDDEAGEMKMNFVRIFLALRSYNNLRLNL